MHRKWLSILLDVLLIGIAFFVMILLKGTPKTYLVEKYYWGLAILATVWFTISLTFDKFRIKKPIRFSSITLNVMFVNFVVLGIIVILMYGFRQYEYSRAVVFGTIGLATLLEILAGNLHYFLVNAPTNGKRPDLLDLPRMEKKIDTEAARERAQRDILIRDLSLSEMQLKKDIVEECGEEAYDFIIRNIELLDPKNLVVSTTTRFNIRYQPDNYLTGIVNLKKINDIRYINKFFETVNAKLPSKGVFIGCAETKDQRKKRILRKFPPGINWVYYFFDYIIKRVFPKFNLTKKIYFFLTRGNNRVVTRAEILGRLVSCGFGITKEEFLNGRFFFVCQKNGNPVFDMNPTYGPFVKLSRVGKGGKTIKVYKMRTMHPYAEYLQEYVNKMHGLEEGGKFRNDFRISSAGKIMRAFWIDELPMLINWMKGDLKLVGVRPITEHYFRLYSKEHQARRIQYRPGLLPPYYAHLPKTIGEIEASEAKYFDEYDKHPFFTNWRYFWRIMYNIIVKRARSK